VQEVVDVVEGFPSYHVGRDESMIQSVGGGGGEGG